MITQKITNSTTYTIDTKAIEAGLRAAETKLGDIGNRTISIEFVTPDESRALNKELRHKDEPTDIISISTKESSIGQQKIEEASDGSLAFGIQQTKEIENTMPIIGQLVICLDLVKENAARAGQSVERELEWVIEHGILHVMGFHHKHDE